MWQLFSKLVAIVFKREVNSLFFFKKTRKIAVYLFDRVLNFVLKWVSCEKGLTRKVTEKTENLRRPSAVKNGATEQKTFMQYQALSEFETHTGADIYQANSVCFIKSRSRKHTAVLLPKRQFGQ